MIFRQAEIRDCEAIVAIIEEAKKHLRASGVDQWQVGYPDRAAMQLDIDNGEAYVLERDGVLAATVTVSFCGEPCYVDLVGGVWENDGPYGVIHRMAVADAFRGGGLSGRLFAEVENLCRDRGIGGIKADTHPENIQMQRLFEKHAYAYRGTVFFQGGDKVAYEKVLRNRERAAGKECRKSV